MSEISLQSPTVFEIGSFHVTNAVLGNTLTTLIVIGILIYFVRNAKLIPGRIQSMIEIVVEMFLELLINAHGSKKAAIRHLPYYVALFIFLIIANQFSIIPLINQIVTGEGDVLFRVATADYGQPITLALITFIASHILALRIAPIKHIGNFIKIGPFFKVRSLGDFANACLELFLGVLDIIGEFGKVISLSSRLFGNVFAGEVMIAVIAGIASWSAYFVPIPFIVLSMFSGLVQAYVFAVLSLQYIAGAVNSVKEEETSATPELATT